MVVEGAEKWNLGIGSTLVLPISHSVISDKLLPLSWTSIFSFVQWQSGLNDFLKAFPVLTFCGQVIKNSMTVLPVNPLQFLVSSLLIDLIQLLSVINNNYLVSNIIRTYTSSSNFLWIYELWKRVANSEQGTNFDCGLPFPCGQVEHIFWIWPFTCADHIQNVRGFV